MKWLIQDLYKYTEVDLDDFDLFDLYHLLLKPITISFRYNKKNYIVQSMIEDDSCVIQFNDKWYRSVDDFFLKAVIDNKRVSEIHQDCYLFEVVE